MVRKLRMILPEIPREMTSKTEMISRWFLIGFEPGLQPISKLKKFRPDHGQKNHEIYFWYAFGMKSQTQKVFQKIMAATFPESTLVLFSRLETKNKNPGILPKIPPILLLVRGIKSAPVRQKNLLFSGGETSQHP